MSELAAADKRASYRPSSTIVGATGGGGLGFLIASLVIALTNFDASVETPLYGLIIVAVAGVTGYFTPDPDVSAGKRLRMGWLAATDAAERAAGEDFEAALSADPDTPLKRGEVRLS